jgi:hypothetical protein
MKNRSTRLTAVMLLFAIAPVGAQVFSLSRDRAGAATLIGSGRHP